jgi:mannosyltransferase
VSKPDDDWYTMWSRDRPPDEVLDCVTTCNVIWTLSFRDWSLPSHEAGAALPAGSRFGQTPAFLRPAEMGFNLVERWQFNQNQVTRAVRWVASQERCKRGLT